MSEATEPKEPKAEKKPGNATVTWSVRIAVAAVLIALLAVAGMQFLATKNYRADQNAVFDEWDDKGTMTLQRFDELTPNASETTETKAESKTISDTTAEFQAKVKHYKGPFKTYKIWAWHQQGSDVVFLPSGKDDGSTAKQE